MKINSKILLSLLFILNSFHQEIINAQTGANYQWAKSIGSISYDQGLNTVVDASGNVYVAGYFNATADFDPGGGTVMMSSAGAKDIFMAKYDANGNYLWAKSIGAGSDDQANDIALDASGNIYITGMFSYSVDFDPGPGTSTLNSPGGYGMFFAKYDANGNYIWAKGVGNTNDESGLQITIDAAGNCIVTGFKRATADFDPGPGVSNLNQIALCDTYFAKYDSNGNYLWAKSMGSPPNGLDLGQTLVTDIIGNIYLTGYFNKTTDFDPGVGTSTLTSVNGTDVYFAKYDGNGNYVWAKSFGSGNDDYCFGIALDASNNVYLTGRLSAPADMDPGPAFVPFYPVGLEDAFFAKFDNNGNYIWANLIGGVSTDLGSSIKIDVLGDIYVSGYFMGSADMDPGTNLAVLYSNGSTDIFFAKYNSAGNYLWAKSVGGTTNDYCTDLEIDPAGNVYITGSFSGNADFDPNAGVANLTWIGGDDIYFAKYANGPLSVNEDHNTNLSYKIYPNPSSGIFNIELNEEASVEIYNSIGQKVLAQVVHSGSNRIEITGFAEGLYYYKLLFGKDRTAAGKLTIN